MIEMANTFNLCVDEDDFRKHPEMILEELSNKKLLELEQEHIAEEKAEKRKLQEEKEKKTSQKLHNEGLSSFLQTSISSVKSLKKTRSPNNESLLMKVFMSKE